MKTFTEITKELVESDETNKSNLITFIPESYEDIVFSKKTPAELIIENRDIKAK